MSTAAAPPKPVFISYTRSYSAEPARALHQSLGPELAFLDVADIGYGEDFVDRLLDAVLGAKVIVLFLDPAYFERRFCWFEYEVAVCLYKTLVERGATEELDVALDHLVVAAPPEFPEAFQERLPPPLRRHSWADSRDTPELCELVRQRIERNTTLSEALHGWQHPEALRTRLQVDLRPRPRLDPTKTHSFRDALPPFLDQDFVGRHAELWLIHHELTADVKTAPKKVVLRGMGGVGKTTLASEYLHRFGDQYPGGRFWFKVDPFDDDDRTSEQLHCLLASVAEEKGVAIPPWPEFRDAGRDVAAELGAALAELAKDQAVLYVVDNVPEPGPGEPLEDFRRWCPVPDAVSLLVTTRFRKNFPGPVEIDVHGVAPEDARAILQSECSNPGALSDEEWDEIATWVDRLPLALQLLKTVVAAKGEARRLRDRARSSVGPLRDLDEAAEMSSSVLPGVREAFAYSYDRLPDEAKNLARVLAQFAATGIPVGVLDALGDELASRKAKRWLLERCFVSDVDDVGGVELFGKMHPVLARLPA